MHLFREMTLVLVEDSGYMDELEKDCHEFLKDNPTSSRGWRTWMV